MPTPSTLGSPALTQKPGSPRSLPDRWHRPPPGSPAARARPAAGPAAPPRRGHPAQPRRPWSSDKMPYSSRPTATASSGCPQRVVTLHRAIAPVSASSPLRAADVPIRSASASAANSATQAIPIEYGLYQQPGHRLRIGAALRVHGDAGHIHDRHDRNQDQRRARERDQAGRRRVQAAHVQLQQPLGRDHRRPQVVGQCPRGPAEETDSPGGVEHPDDDQARRGERGIDPPHRQRRVVTWPATRAVCPIAL